MKSLIVNPLLVLIAANLVHSSPVPAAPAFESLTAVEDVGLGPRLTPISRISRRGLCLKMSCIRERVSQALPNNLFIDSDYNNGRKLKLAQAEELGRKVAIARRRYKESPTKANSIKLHKVESKFSELQLMAKNSQKEFKKKVDRDATGPYGKKLKASSVYMDSQHLVKEVNAAYSKGLKSGEN